MGRPFSPRQTNKHHFTGSISTLGVTRRTLTAVRTARVSASQNSILHLYQASLNEDCAGKTTVYEKHSVLINNTLELCNLTRAFLHTDVWQVHLKKQGSSGFCQNTTDHRAQFRSLNSVSDDFHSILRSCMCLHPTPLESRSR